MFALIMLTFAKFCEVWEMVACTYKDVKRANRGQPSSGKIGVLQLSGDRVFSSTLVLNMYREVVGNSRFLISLFLLTH
jgi:hypothetical protein